ncbi:MAG: hypothetical protein K2X39_03220, partial [Silvanigrellaceae bacterium]|nr:hypothetical protein [Silvanigrellaceae bacterium]
MGIKQEIIASSRQEDRERIAQQWANTLLHNNDRATEIAALLISCIAEGDFKVRDYSTQQLTFPSSTYSHVDFMSHGSRIAVDYKELSDDNCKVFLTYFLTELPNIVARSATHDISRIDNSIKEGKSLLLGIVGQFPSFLKIPRDFGINIAMGGEGQKNFEGKTITANGYSGHFYFHRNDKDKLLLVGLEQSAP